jgi:hypothetical protein
MRRLRFFLALTLALLVGGGAWLTAGSGARPASAPVHAQAPEPGRALPLAPDRAMPDGLTPAGWRAIQTQVAKVTSADGAASDWFGYSASADGDVAVVGAPKADVGGSVDQGAAYVFHRDQGGADAWGQVAKLVAADGAAGDRFGFNVSVSGDTAVVGADRADVGGNVDQGAAYVFYRDQGGAGAWGQVAKLTSTDGAADDNLGVSVSLSGDLAVAGAWNSDAGGGYDEGAAFVFSRDQGGADAWGQVAVLTTADGAPGDDVGWSVSIGGDTALVGARYAEGGGPSDQGAAYVFRRDQGGPGAWGQVAKLTAPDGQAPDWFGVWVSVDGDTAAVGAFGADVGGIPQGAAYVFFRDQGGPDGWGQVAVLAAADGAAGDLFGASVALSGDTVVAGAPFAGIGGKNRQGAAYVYYGPYATLHLNALLLRWAAGAGPSTYAVSAYARVHDQGHALASGVRVTGQWTRPDGSKQNQARVTAANGVAAFTLPTSQSGTFRFCVGGLVKAGYAYLPADNETQVCKTVVVGP